MPGASSGDTLGIEVPKGHVEVLEAAAENLTQVAHAAGRAGREMRRAAKVDGWEGSASRAFAQAIGENAKPADIAEEQLPRAAEELRELADQLRAARHATKHAITVARAAAKRREDAERDGVAAQRRATDHATEAAALQGVIDGAATRGDPAHASREAQSEARRAALHAEDAAADARRRAQQAVHDLQDAQRDGRMANERYDLSCQRAAKVLRSVAAAAPGAGGGGDEHLTWKDVYAVFWSGGKGERYPPARKVAKALAMVWSMKKYLRAHGASEYWKVINPAYRQLMRNQKLPTWNNGMIGKRLVGPLSKLPGMKWVTNATKAGPVFRGVGVAANIPSLVDDAGRLLNPSDDPATLASDIAKTGFDVSTTAFFIAPNPVTGGAVIVTGVAWAGTEAWQHWDDVGPALDKGVDAARDTAETVAHGAKDLASDAVGGIKHVFGG